jgi:hypothetical protein
VTSDALGMVPLKSFHHDSIQGAISQWTINAGFFPKCLYTDFDPKILEGPTRLFLHESKVILQVAPKDLANSNKHGPCICHRYADAESIMVLGFMPVCENLKLRKLKCLFNPQSTTTTIELVPEGTSVSLHYFFS